MADIKVYKFGARWHWRCDRGGKGRCLGGPKRTQQEAYEAARTHYADEHQERDEAHKLEYARWAAEGADQ